MESDKKTITITVAELLQFAYRRLWLNLSIVVISAGFFVAFFFAAERRYDASATVVPALETNGSGLLGSLVGNLGPLAELAGAGLGGGTNSAIEARAFLGSRALLRSFVERHSLLPEIFADRWDHENAEWDNEPPTIEEAVDRLQKSVFTVVQDRTEGTIRIRCRWKDPITAARWVNDLVALANESIRERESDKARHAIAVLQEEYDNSSQIEIKQVVLRLMEAQLQQLTFARVREQYAFEVIDPAFPPGSDDPVSPNKIVFLVLWGFTSSAIFLAMAMLNIARAKNPE